MPASGAARPACVLIGLGRIGEAVARALTASSDGPALSAIVTRTPDRAKALFPDVSCYQDLDRALGDAEIVIECASPDVLAGHGPRILAEGRDLVPISLSAFAGTGGPALVAALEKGPGRLFIPSGAACALPLLDVARCAGLDRVVFRQTYPPALWARLEGLSDARAYVGTFLSASAREAARRFPRNLNAAIGVALAGLGLDRTEIELIGDPAIANRRYEIEIESGGAPIRLAIGPYGTEPDRPDHTAASLLSILRRRQARMVF
ncbi:DUF108 domain-containing protein [Arsenicitalea aurantiaca]|uniref:DUF108 domain-containing protein n=1 Tax=Arsenicitalea aurantiaca TaxID=1783274 RepID=A0A433X5C5_9HYPH|nr:aspartate dehydrogenase domain-containing protein [Arsenicitalea aurantiaca]RUT29254.1 DUF108 domain-containing protein [Arsenicitalea aurantiaca]